MLKHIFGWHQKRAIAKADLNTNIQNGQLQGVEQALTFS